MKLKVSWTPDINQDLDALCNPKSPFYEKEIADKINEMGREEFIKLINQSNETTNRYPGKDN